MPIDNSSEEYIPTDSDACYETLARQEELYLEETEEELRAILTSDDRSPSRATAEYWRSKIAELELDWQMKKFYD